jgi:hypothetical protein
MENNSKLCCDICKKQFRDNYNLKRHTERKKTCDTNIKTNNEFGDEDLSHIITEDIIQEWRIVNKTSIIEYVRAGNLILSFHKLVNQNNSNCNIKLPYIGSKGIKINTINLPVNIGIDQFLKIRSGQLLTYKDTIKEINERVFSIEANVKTWRNVENFHKLGREHKGFRQDDTRLVLSAIKYALL